jgi:GNAT superfamily N-acetyltransferase
MTIDGGDRHPAHDEVAAEVASWYTSSAPAMGYELEERWCGLFTTPASLIGPRAVLRVGDEAAVAAALAEVRAAFPASAAEVWVEGREAAERLHPSLLAHGCELRARTVYLALVGPLLGASGPDDLEIEVVTPASVGEWVLTQHLGFAGIENRPGPETLADEVERRHVEIADVGRLWLARLDGEPVGGLAFYDGDDRLVNSLATRVPFRGRGVAQALLQAFVEDSARRGCRSSLINADADDWPVRLYRRIGFTDEILFHARLTLAT